MRGSSVDRTINYSTVVVNGVRHFVVITGPCLLRHEEPWRFFVDRPILALVVPVLLTLAGVHAIFIYPNGESPRVAPPTVQVKCSYPGADSRTVAVCVAEPIEVSVSGAEGLLHLCSRCANDGSYTLTLTFEPGMDVATARKIVADRLPLQQLPGEVSTPTTRMHSAELLLIVSIYSPNGSSTPLAVDPSATVEIRHTLASVPGVGEMVCLSPNDPGVRLCLDPKKLTDRGLCLCDVADTVRKQLTAAAPLDAGLPGDPRFRSGIPGLIRRPEDFENLVIAAVAGSGEIHVKDVGHVAVGAVNGDAEEYFDGKPCVSIALFPYPDTDPIAVSRGVRAKLEELKPHFPQGLAYEIAYDRADFLRASVETRERILVVTVLLLVLFLSLSLRRWLLALLALTEIFVALAGTLAALALCGLNLNTVTSLSLGVVSGVVAGDLVMVLGHVERRIEAGLAPRDATISAMSEVSGPLMSGALVLCFLFLPCAFVGDDTGRFFQQFAVPIVAGTLISTFLSLSLTPALSAICLRPQATGSAGFGRVLGPIRGLYIRLAEAALSGRLVVLPVYVGLLLVACWGISRLHQKLVPVLDQGHFMAEFQLAEAAPGQGRGVFKRIDQIVRHTPGIAHTITSAGQALNLGARGPNFGSAFVTLDDFDRRRASERPSDILMNKLREQILQEAPDARVFLFGPPTIAGRESTDALQCMVVDRGHSGLATLQEQAERLVAKANGRSPLANWQVVSAASPPQVFADVDRDRAARLGMTSKDITDVLQIYLNSCQVGECRMWGRTWPVVIQAEASSQNQIDDIRRLLIRGTSGPPVSLGQLADIRESTSPPILLRYDLHPAVAIHGHPTPGHSAGEAIASMEGLAQHELQPPLALEWTDAAFMQPRETGTAGMMVLLALPVVFLVLAMQHYGWSLPSTVILALPMGILCSVAGIALVGSEINIFTCIGLLMLMAMASKNAILLVVLAQRKHGQGLSIRDAALQAYDQRLRPMVLSSFACLLALSPLLVADGPGVEWRRSLAYPLFSGMLGVALFGIILGPLFYCVIEWTGETHLFRSPFVHRLSDLALLLLIYGRVVILLGLVGAVALH
jgi:multidrug efflux pump